MTAASLLAAGVSFLHGAARRERADDVHTAPAAPRAARGRDE